MGGRQGPPRKGARVSGPRGHVNHDHDPVSPRWNGCRQKGQERASSGEDLGKREPPHTPAGRERGRPRRRTRAGSSEKRKHGRHGTRPPRSCVFPEGHEIVSPSGVCSPVAMSAPGTTAGYANGTKCPPRDKGIKKRGWKHTRGYVPALTQQENPPSATRDEAGGHRDKGSEQTWGASIYQGWSLRLGRRTSSGDGRGPPHIGDPACALGGSPDLWAGTECSHACCGPSDRTFTSPGTPG